MKTDTEGRQPLKTETEIGVVNYYSQGMPEGHQNLLRQEFPTGCFGDSMTLPTSRLPAPSLHTVREGTSVVLCHVICGTWLGQP